MNRRPPRSGERVEKTQHTLLLDANGLFKNGVFGASNLYNKHGQQIGGIYQFLTTLRKILSEDLYHRVYAFWDGNFSGKLRYELYEPYKSARGKDYINGTQPYDESELRQRRLVWEYLNDLYIRQLRHEIVESDDFIAYYCLHKKPNERITIVTNDRDMCQLISDDIRIYFCDAAIKNYVDKSNYSEYFCHKQENALLVKMLIGDDSDSIKGVKGLGEKTLLKYFPEIKERSVKLSEVIEGARKQQEDRLSKKLKPILVLDNIANGVTDGIQGRNLYRINEQIINLKKPLLTNDGIRALNELINGTLDNSGRDLKNVLKYMERDGIKDELGEYRYADYLLPFKKLIDREKNSY